jgi:chaperonin cofactor prefoldin
MALRAKDKERKRNLARLERRLAELENQIETCERQLEELDRELAKGQKPWQHLSELAEQRKGVEATLSEALQAWEELGLQIAAAKEP